MNLKFLEILRNLAISIGFVLLIYPQKTFSVENPHIQYAFCGNESSLCETENIIDGNGKINMRGFAALVCDLRYDDREAFENIIDKYKLCDEPPVSSIKREEWEREFESQSRRNEAMATFKKVMSSYIGAKNTTKIFVKNVNPKLKSLKSCEIKIEEKCKYKETFINGEKMKGVLKKNGEWEFVNIYDNGLSGLFEYGCNQGNTARYIGDTDENVKTCKDVAENQIAYLKNYSGYFKILSHKERFVYYENAYHISFEPDRGLFLKRNNEKDIEARIILYTKDRNKAIELEERQAEIGREYQDVSFTIKKMIVYLSTGRNEFSFVPESKRGIGVLVVKIFAEID